MAVKLFASLVCLSFSGVATAGLLDGLSLFSKSDCPAPCPTPAPACAEPACPAPACVVEAAPACESCDAATDYGLPAGATVISVTPAGGTVATPAPTESDSVPEPTPADEPEAAAEAETAEAAPAPPGYAAGGDIVDTAVAAGDFGTLAAALTAAELVETLKGDGPFTVFAPTDEAFAALPEGTLDDLLKPENKEKLTTILLYHVVPGKVPAADVVNLASARTSSGKKVSIAVDGETVKVDGATVLQTDVEATNGLIHVIDAVLLPSDD